MRKWLLAWAFSLASASALAQGITSVFPGPGTPAGGGGGGFQGIGDKQSGISFYWGVIPYSAAYAAAGGKSFHFSCNAGVITGDVVFQSSGALVLTPIAACVGTIDVLPSDQSGANICGSSQPCDLNNLLSGSFVFLQSGCPSTAVVTYCFSATSVKIATALSASNISQPFTITGVVDRPVAGAALTESILGDPSFSGAGLIYAPSSTLQMYALTAASFTATDGNTNTYQILYNGASSLGWFNNASSVAPSTNPGTSAMVNASGQGIGYTNSFFTGFIYELGTYPSDITANAVAVGHNQCLNTGSASYPTC